MGNNQTTTEIEDGETGEVTTITLTALVSNVRDLFLSKIRGDREKKTWSKMSQDEQQKEIDHADDMARKTVIAVAELIATGKNAVIHAILDNYKVKGGEVTVTAKGLADDGAVLALNHVGKKALKIIVVDYEQYDQDGKPAVADPDQPDLLDGEDDKPGQSLAEAMQEAIDADEANKAAQEGEGNAEPEIDDAVNLSPYDQGNGSAAHGLSAKANPFKRGSRDYNDWQTGFDAFTLAQKQEAEADQPEIAEEPQLEGTTEVDDQDVDLSDTEDEQTQEAVDPKKAGADARMDGAGPDENPYDGGTDEYSAWRAGYEKVDDEMNTLVETGRAARREGFGPKKNPYKKDTKAHELWVQGYEEAKAAETDTE